MERKAGKCLLLLWQTRQWITGRLQCIWSDVFTLQKYPHSLLKTRSRKSCGWIGKKKRRKTQNSTLSWPEVTLAVACFEPLCLIRLLPASSSQRFFWTFLSSAYGLPFFFGFMTVPCCGKGMLTFSSHVFYSYSRLICRRHVKNSTDRLNFTACYTFVLLPQHKSCKIIWLIFFSGYAYNVNSDQSKEKLFHITLCHTEQFTVFSKLHTESQKFWLC